MSVITISRQFGSAGWTIAKRVARELSFTLVDNEIIDKIAEDTQVSREWVKKIENESDGAILRYISGLRPFGANYVERITARKKGFIDGRIYIDHLYRILPEIADRGNVLFVGRGSQYILKNRKDGFHVLIIAAFEDRVKFLMDKYSLSENDAKKLVKKQEKKRNNFFELLGKRDFDLPNRYHLTLNRSHLDIDKSVKLIRDLIVS